MSVSSVSLSSDANVRYQRLAQEYTKLRSQAKVLREGVLEERAKTEKLTEEVKSKDATIRRLEAENESLTFRNDQLVRRVETFQSQFDSSHQNPQKSSKKHEALPPNAAHAKLDLLEQELEQKLRENEKLVNELAESERRHAHEMAEMSEKLATEMRKLEEEVRRMRFRTNGAKPKEEEEEAEKLEEIGSPEPPETHEEARIMVAEAARGTFSALHNVFNLLQQRSEIYPYDVTMERLPPHVEKLSSEYAQTARLFSDLVQIADDFLSCGGTASDHLPLITSKCRLIARHCLQLLAELVRQMTSEENRVTWCTAPLSKLNARWEQLILNAFAVFDRMSTVLESDFEKHSQKVLAELQALADVSVELSECFQQRWVFESRLPTTSRRMRCVGGALEAALQLTAQETSKLSARAARVEQMGRNEQNSAECSKTLELSVKIEQTTLDITVKPQKPSNPFDEEDPEDPEVPEPSAAVPEPQEQAPPPKEEQNLRNELDIFMKNNEELQKERDKLFVEYSLVKRKLEIATNDGEKLDKKETDLDNIWAIGMEKRQEWVRRVIESEQAVRFYETEMKALIRHELHVEEQMQELRAELESAAGRNHRLEDELESVRRSYESQLGDLSDHLATLVAQKQPKEKETSKSRGTLKSFFNKS
ncbi:unnamed protein product [Caenorhabditis sp. 36 PRJEB53466]|nr:unnamed protein product [Caenorhabditis sp. 36 PRJEB53466]